MALLTIAEAARATGKDRTTIHRKLKAGELSATVNETGERRIDTAELVRVFGPLHATADAPPAVATPVRSEEPPTNEGSSARTAAPDATQAALLDMLKGQLAQSADRERWLKEQLEAEQQVRRELETRLLPPPPRPEPPLPWWLLWVALPVAAAVLGYASKRWM